MISRSSWSMTGTTVVMHIYARAPRPGSPGSESVLTAFSLCELLITATSRVGVRADAGWRTPFVAGAPRLANQTQLHTTAVLGRWRHCGAARLLACGSRHASRRRAHSRCRTRARRRACSRRCRSCCVRTCGPSSRAILCVTLCTAAPRHGDSTLHALACALIDAASALACATGAAAPEDGGVVVHGVAGGVSVKGHYRSGWLSRSQAGHEPVRPVTRTGVSSEGERRTGPTGPQ